VIKINYAHSDHIPSRLVILVYINNIKVFRKLSRMTNNAL